MRKTTLVAACAALALTLTACGAKPGATSNDGAAAKPELSLATPFTDAVQLAAASKQGTEKSKSAKFTMQGSAAGKSISAAGGMTIAGADTKFTMTMTTEGQQIEMRLVDKAMYMKMPPEQAKQLGSDKPWVKLSLDGSDPLSQAMGGALSQSANQSDPSKVLEQISKAGRIISSDQTQLNGQPVNHYKVELDIAKALDQFTDSVPAASKDKIKDMFKGKDVKVPAELWLDKDNLPVQITMDQGPMMKAMGVPGAEDAKFTMKYTDWGTQIDVEAPAADQVTDISKMLGGH